ncbi:MAG: trimeric intracellular cation channel family protein [Salinisphaera sp.]|jgi:uncharacterized membrane protein YeiH|nr:trimeric intracellular cation channel family protein [Salinisphaera sp.]
MHILLSVLDIVGTFVFAISGAMAGVYKRLDMFGIAVLAFATGTVGGIFRDLLIGAAPPLAISDPRYVATTIVASILVFYGHRFFERIERPVAIFDAAGLSMFAVTGSVRALDFGVPPVMAVLLGMLTGIGGGMVRDILLARVPAVLQQVEIYAVAALAGAGLAVLGVELSWPFVPTALAAAGLCFFIRFMALRRGWRLPGPRLDK